VPYVSAARRSGLSPNRALSARSWSSLQQLHHRFWPEWPKLHKSTVGQARATGTLTVVDRLRPSNEDIVKAFRQATEDRQPVEAQDAALDTDEPAIAGPVPLTKKAAAAAPVTPGAPLVASLPGEASGAPAAAENEC